MNSYFLLWFILLIFLVPTNGEIDLSFTHTTWFWPFIGVCLVLLVSIPCAFVVFIVICYGKHKLIDDCDQSSITSNASSISVEHDRPHRYSRHRRLHYSESFPSPPPPYTTSEQPRSLFITSSPAPSYRTDVPTDRSSIDNSPPTIDRSPILTSSTIQTSHV